MLVFLFLGLALAAIFVYTKRPERQPVEISPALAKLESNWPVMPRTGTGSVAIASEPAAVPLSKPEMAKPSALAVSTTPSVFPTIPAAHIVTYQVQSGDNLTRIAKTHKTTVELIQRLNGLSSDRIMPGMKLKVPDYAFSVVVDKSQNTLILKGGEEVLKSYSVSTGTNNSTPAGVFKVTDKLLNPTWYKAGAVVPPDSADNVLGTRWIGINQKGYGIHGTTEPDKLGQQVTAGCVRMKNEEVEELYAFLTPGSEVTIVD